MALGRGTAADLVLAVGEVAVFAALAITILVKVGPGHYSASVSSPARLRPGISLLSARE